jgi:hypothetical protein
MMYVNPYVVGTTIRDWPVIDTKAEPEETVVVQYEHRYKNLYREYVLSEFEAALIEVDWFKPIDSTRSTWLIDLSRLKAQNRILERLKWLEGSIVVTAEFEITQETAFKETRPVARLKFFVRRAEIPFHAASGYNPALFVLESEANQGTAFKLSGMGLITCDHVLAPNTAAFNAGRDDFRYPVDVLKRSPYDEIDLAICKIGIDSPFELVMGATDNLRIGDQVTLVGFPNYRIGATEVQVPGFIIGFRPLRGIRRFLIDAPIVFGNSGGPVLDSEKRVIGVAATGTDDWKNRTDVEYGVIPIDALHRLR